MSRRKPTSIDLAKASLIPLVLGFFTSSAYYSHFRVPAISLLTPQCIVTGLYVIIVYGLVPWGVMKISAKFSKSLRTQRIVTIAALFTADTVALYIIRHIIKQSLIGSVLGLVLQIVFLETLAKREPSSTIQSDSTPLSISLSGLLVIVFCCVHFAIYVFPYVPYYYAGGRPITVYVVPSEDSKSVLDDVFIERKDVPSINPDLPTYRMVLLYETSDDYYFLAKRTGSITVNQQVVTDVFFGTIVSRVRRSTVSRLDYSTPATLNLKELFK